MTIEEKQTKISFTPYAASLKKICGKSFALLQPLHRDGSKAEQQPAMACVLFFLHRKPALPRHLGDFGNRLLENLLSKSVSCQNSIAKKSLKVNSLCFTKPKFYMVGIKKIY